MPSSTGQSRAPRPVSAAPTSSVDALPEDERQGSIVFNLIDVHVNLGLPYLHLGAVIEAARGGQRALWGLLGREEGEKAEAPASKPGPPAKAA